MEFLDTEKEIDRYVCKVSDDSYEGEITLLNVTYEKEDSMEDNKETYGQMFDFLQKFSRENLIVSDLDENGEKITRERAAIRLFNIYMYLDEEEVKIGYIFNMDYKDVMSKQEFVVLQNGEMLLSDELQRSVDLDTRTELNKSEIRQLFESVLCNVIKDSHRCDEIIRDLQIPNNILLFSFDYYRNRSPSQGGIFHRDSFGNTKYVTLIFNNKEAIYGTEILPSSLCVENAFKQTGQPFNCNDIRVCRPVLNPFYATIGFNDSFVQHSTPTYRDYFDFESGEYVHDQYHSNSEFILYPSHKRNLSNTPGIKEFEKQQRTFLRVWTNVYSDEYYIPLIEKIRKNGFIETIHTIDSLKELLKNTTKLTIKRNLVNPDYVAIFNQEQLDFSNQIGELNKMLSDKKQEIIQLNQILEDKKSYFENRIASSMRNYDHEKRKNEYGSNSTKQRVNRSNIDFFEPIALKQKNNEDFVENHKGLMLRIQKNFDTEQDTIRRQISNANQEFVEIRGQIRTIYQQSIDSKQEYYTRYIKEVMPLLSLDLCDTTLNRGGKKRRSKTKRKRAKKRKTRNKK